MKKLLVLVILIFASAAFADVTIKENSDGAELVTYFSRGMSAHYVDGQVTNITDMNAGTITVMNPMSKTYFQATLAQMKNLADSLNEKMKSIQSNPQYQAMLKQQADSVKVSKQGSEQIAGFFCTKYSISLDMPPTKADICLSKDLADLVSKEISSKQLEKIMDSLDSGDGGMDMLTGKISELEEKNGYLMSENIDMMGTGISTVVTEVSKKSINKSVFDIPSDYTRKPMPQAFGEY
jgi:hypothetical protein